MGWRITIITANTANLIFLDDAILFLCGHVSSRFLSIPGSPRLCHLLTHTHTHTHRERERERERTTTPLAHLYIPHPPQKRQNPNYISSVHPSSFPPITSFFNYCLFRLDYLVLQGKKCSTWTSWYLYPPLPLEESEGHGQGRIQTREFFFRENIEHIHK